MAQLRQYADMKLLMEAARSMERDMKGAVDAEFEARYLEDGTRTRDVLEGGERIASLTWVPSSPATERPVLLVDDEEAFAVWARENGYTVPDMEACAEHFARTGELPDGCAASTKAVGGKRGFVKVTPTKEYKAAFEGGAIKYLERGR